VATVLRLLSPFAPHMACELWEALVQGPDLDSVPWPEHDAAALVRDQIEVAVQINGKVRSRIVLGSEATDADAIAAALDDSKIAAELAGRTPHKTVYVRGRLVSMVVA
jgi:leucyl-tRNA synthetase